MVASVVHEQDCTNDKRVVQDPPCRVSTTGTMMPQVAGSITIHAIGDILWLDKEWIPSVSVSGITA